ncbi:hypothetical protein [Ramlibacter tataouinensis]|nr:hypothetical protein [Ramlibacter tataouinensis]
MKLLLPVLTALLMSACASAPPANPAAAQAYPAWLEMKPGYAEACISAGGCVPMTQGELQQMAAEIMQRTMQVCRRTSDI